MASIAFDKILKEIQTSKLNFQLQVSPFSAQISLKKSLVKDRNRSCRLPPESSFTRKESEFSALQTNMQLENDLKVLRTKYERAVSDCEEAFNRIKCLEGFENKHFKIETEQKVKEELTHEIAAALKTENEKLQARNEDQNSEIKDLQNSLKVRIKVPEKLNKELRENKVKAENENTSLITSYKAEIKSWRKDLGDVTKQNVKLEKKLEESLVSDTKYTLQSETKAVPEPSTFLLPRNLCNRCAEEIVDHKQKFNSASDDSFKGGNSGPDSTDLDPLFIPSLVSHWDPQFTTTFQRPANTSSMITHCALHPSPGSSLMSMEEVLEAFEKFIAK